MGFPLTQDIEKRKAKLKTPLILSLTPDIVAGPQAVKWGLKYVI
jgi:hypothetical protein